MVAPNQYWAYYFLKGNYLAGGALFGITILFNYGVAITIAAILILFSAIQYFDKKKNFAIYAGLIIIIGLGIASPWLLVSASRMGECFDPSTVVASINEPGEQYLWMMLLPLLAVFVLLLKPNVKKKEPYLCFWKAAFALGMFGFVVSLFIPQLHPYDQLLLFGFSATFLLADIKLKKEYKIAILCLLIIATFMAVLAVKPVLSEGDIAAADWIRDNADGLVLANLEISGTINMLVMSERVETVFDQFLECVPNKERWVAVNEAFMSSDADAAQITLDSYGVKYVVVGQRDKEHYGFDIDKFESMEYDVVFIAGESKIYKRR